MCGGEFTPVWMDEGKIGRKEGKEEALHCSEDCLVVLEGTNVSVL